MKDINEEIYCILRHTNIKGYTLEEYKKLAHLNNIGEFYYAMKTFVAPHMDLLRENDLKQVAETLLPEKYEVTLREDADVEDIRKSVVYLMGIYDYLEKNSKPGY